ncbi:hypothetical protein TNCV_3421851 [Trichonephila clavipes]|nr:hypothetical protein TNCV_3421851 [Trichonephila clavipes]
MGLLLPSTLSQVYCNADLSAQSPGVRRQFSKIARDSQMYLGVTLQLGTDYRSFRDVPNTAVWGDRTIKQREGYWRRTKWSTTAELSSRHSSYTADSSSIRVAGGGKREDTARPRASQSDLSIFSGIKVGWIYWPRNPFTLQIVLDAVRSTCVIVH